LINLEIFIPQACVIKQHFEKEPIQTVNFVLCFFAEIDLGKNIADSAQYCLNENVPLPEWGRIDECARDDQGDKILKEYQDRVEALETPLTHVPWVIIEKKHDALGEKDLMQDICDRYYNSEKPDACIPPLIPVGIYYETLSSDVRYFMEENINPTHSIINNLAELDLVPYGLTKREGDNFTCEKPDQCEANMYHVS